MSKLDKESVELILELAYRSIKRELSNKNIISTKDILMDNFTEWNSRYKNELVNKVIRRLKNYEGTER